MSEIKPTLRQLIEHERMIRHVALARAQASDVIELREAMGAVDAYCNSIAELESYAALGRAVEAMQADTYLERRWNGMWRFNNIGAETETPFEVMGIPAPETDKA